MSFPTDYTKYQIVTIDADQVSATLSDFTVFIDLSIFDKIGADIFDTCRTDGGDIRVTLSDGVTQLAREIVSVDTSAKTGEMHVKIPSLSSVTDTSLMVWYNGSDMEPAEDSTYGKENAWASDYAMVQHMNQDPSGTAPQMIDSTANDNDGTSGGSMTSGDLVAGQIGDALDFDGINDYVNVNNSSSIGTINYNLSISFWFKNSVATVMTILHKSSSSVSDYYRIYQSGSSQKIFFYINNGSSSSNFSAANTYNDGLWHHYIGVRDVTNGKRRIYVDGSLEQEVSDTVSGSIDTNSALKIGQSTDGSSTWNGSIDEVKISNTAKSSDWISTEYANQTSPSTFYIVSDEQGGSYIISLNAIVDNESSTSGIDNIIVRHLTGNIANTSLTYDISNHTLREILFNVYNQSNISDVSVTLTSLIQFTANIISLSSTNGIDARIERCLSSVISNQSITADVSIILEALISLYASINNQSVTSSIDKTIRRVLTSSISNQSFVSDIEKRIIRSLTAAIANDSLISVIYVILANLISLASSVSNQSNTYDIGISIFRNLTANISSQSATTALGILKIISLTANIKNDSSIVDIDLIMAILLAANITNQSLTADSASIVLGALILNAGDVLSIEIAQDLLRIVITKDNYGITIN